MCCQVLGVNIARLLLAMAQVESEQGATSQNVYQLRPIFLRDCNRILAIKNAPDYKPFRLADRFDRHRSEEAIAVYLAFYGQRYANKTGQMPTFEVFARIHNGGPDGWVKNCTLRYWEKVSSKLVGLSIDDGALWVARDFQTDYDFWWVYCSPNTKKDNSK